MTTPLSLGSSTWTEARDGMGESFVAILPVGSTEAHGPHLPLATDVIIAEGMAWRAAQKLAERGRRAICLPPLSYAVTDCAVEFPGTVSVRTETIVSLVLDIARSTAKQGSTLLCLSNAHLEPAHRDCLKRALEAGEKEGLRIVFPDCVRKPHALELGQEFRSGACHAGEYETSLVLALKPEWVRRDIQRALADFPVSIGKALQEGKKTFREAGSELAYFGAPASASAENGRVWVEALATMLVQEIEAAS